MTELLIISSTTDQTQFKSNSKLSPKSFKITATTGFEETDNGVSSDLHNTNSDETSQNVASADLSVPAESVTTANPTQTSIPLSSTNGGITGGGGCGGGGGNGSSGSGSGSMTRRSGAALNFDPRRELDRLKSFTPHWPSRFIEPREMAKCGFYYYQRRDYVRCAFCKIEICNWQEDDDVLVEHRRWSARCPFLRGVNVGNVPLDASTVSVPQELSANLHSSNNGSEDRGYDTCGLYGIGTRPNRVPENNSASLTTPRQGSTSSNGGTGVESPGYDTCGPYGIEIRPNSVLERSTSVENNFFNTEDMIPIIGPQYPNLCTVDSRLKTYRDWPRSISQGPKALSESGFFYTGQGDKVVCFSCGGGLKNWGPLDDPWNNHAKWFSKCSYVLIVKGREFVEEIGRISKPLLNVKEVCELSCQAPVTNATPTTSSTSTTSEVVAGSSNHQCNNCNNNNRTANNHHHHHHHNPNHHNCSSSLSNLPQREPISLPRPRPQSQSQPKPPLNGTWTVSSPGSTGSHTAVDPRKEIEDGRLCKICYSDELQVAFIPCRHIVACAKCAPSLTICAVCKQKFTAVVRVFLC